MSIVEHTTICCPICNSQSDFAYSIDTQKMKEGLSSIFHTAIPSNVLKTDYAMRTCRKCTLTFAQPLKAGDNDFYTFITSQNGYYTNFRLEYQLIWNKLKHTESPIKLLDIGCGDGSFLQGCSINKLITPIGIDTTHESVIKANEKGIEAYHTAIENFNQSDFDIIVSFHCLEHIENPIEFISNAFEKLKPNGKLFISTPYSPVSYEYFWFHPLNNPPHHTLRLNKKSYQELANKLHLKTKFYNVEKMSVKSHIASCFSYAKFGKMERNNLFKKMLLSPLLTLKVIYKIMNREKIDGVIVGSEILVEFYK